MPTKRAVSPSPLTPAHLDRLVAHAVRHAHENGGAGGLIFSVYGVDHRPTAAQISKHCQDGWARGLDEPRWLRTWALWDGERIVGHADLVGGGLHAGMHRCRLGMGIERPYRGAGWGGRLLDQVIAWATAQGLSWLDLGVFAHNEAARRLYVSRGFREVGRVEDCFRVDGRRVDDLLMVLGLRGDGANHSDARGEPS